MSLVRQFASSNFITVNKTLIKALGLEEAVVLGELCSEYDYWESQSKLVDGRLFYCTVAKLEDTTGLSDYKQRTIIKSLEEAGVIKTHVKGVPATRYFEIFENKILEILRTSSQKIQELDFKKLESSNNIIIKTRNKSILDKSKIDIPKTAIETQTFIDLYTQLCPSLPKCLKATSKRAEAIRKIIAKYSLDEIKQVFTNAENSDFLVGYNDRGWKASIDFILREDKFVAILEGKYGGKKSKASMTSTDIRHDKREDVDKQKFWEDVKNGRATKF